MIISVVFKVPFLVLKLVFNHMLYSLAMTKKLIFWGNELMLAGVKISMDIRILVYLFKAPYVMVFAGTLILFYNIKYDARNGEQIF